MSIHIGNLHNDANKRDLEYEFDRYGRIRSMWIARSPPGFAFIEFEDQRDAEDAIRDMDGRSILGRRVRVQWKNDSSRSGDRGNGDRGDGSRGRESRKPTRSEHRVKISGLASGTTWKDLKSLFKEKTEPVYVDLRGDGNAVAEFAVADDVGLAIDTYDGQEFNGSKISIAKDDKGEDDDAWQKFDTRPRRSDRGREGGRGRARSRSRDRISRSRSRDRRYDGRRESRDYREDRRGQSRERMDERRRY